MNKPLILVVEDDIPVRNLITITLKTHGYRYLTAGTGDGAVVEASSHNPDVVLLDLGLPDMDGVDVIRKIRTWSNLPIIVISARSEDTDKIDALDAGADDYLTKPFAMGELLARIRAMTRRRTEFAPSTLTFGNVSLNRQSFELSGPNGSQKLGNKEFQMIEALMLNHGTLISTERFMEKIWGYDSDAEINVVWVYISYLRKKLGLIGADVEIKATRGVGYTLEEKHND
mgnify:CR=1 FL=1